MQTLTQATTFQAGQFIFAIGNLNPTLKPGHADIYRDANNVPLSLPDYFAKLVKEQSGYLEAIGKFLTMRDETALKDYRNSGPLTDYDQRYLTQLAKFLAEGSGVPPALFMALMDGESTTWGYLAAFNNAEVTLQAAGAEPALTEQEKAYQPNL